MRNKKAEALGLSTLLVVIVAAGVGLGIVGPRLPFALFSDTSAWPELGNLALVVLAIFTGALVAAWLAAGAVLEGQRSLKDELAQQRAELAALRAAMTAAAEQDHQALPAGGEPEIEFR